MFIISIFILFLLCAYQHSFLLFIILTPLTPIIANTINIYDKIKNKHFINKAIKKLKNHPTQIIAITGSNGKTSVKNILHQMLSTQHKVQATPASYNTPLGIATFVNNELKHETEFLILEYGARRKNDIKKLCNLFGADLGIITTISSQHLETFKSVENIFSAKQELSKHLQNKPCVFNIDNIFTKRMHNEKSSNNISVSINQKADIFANNIRIENMKTTFNLHTSTHTHNLATQLLGRHNILNICLASALSTHLGIDDKNIISTIQDLKPIKHRLELINSHINILDDTYNCSPESAKEALWVLKNFSGKKMVATPGIIECGKEKYNINFNLGTQMSFCDYCIIIGNENKQAILDGIKKEIEGRNLQPHIILASSLNEAKQHFSKLNRGDTLLLLNDLPDDYR